MPYTYSDELSTSDEAFCAWGYDLSELCVSVCDALIELMVVNPEQIAAEERRELALSCDSVEELIRNLLEKLLFYKDAEGVVVRLQQPEFCGQVGNVWQLKGEAWGEAIDPSRHETGVDVKAVTYHNFRVEWFQDKWQACVVVDV